MGQSAERAVVPRAGLALAVVLLLCAATTIRAVHASPSGSSWTFQVTLDGDPIGEHRFSVTPASDGDQRTMRSEADFTVRLLAIPVYRYQHVAIERWRGDCLIGLSADTDDNGKRTHVTGAQTGDVFEVREPQVDSARGCVMSFAYWNPAFRTQQRLVNAQTGRIEPVRVAPIRDADFKVRDQKVAAQGWRIVGLARPIDVWYSADGDWIGLDTRVDGGRMLSYRRT